MKLLVLGASARAAAASAVRAGFQPSAIDLFADTDLIALGAARRVPVESYPAALESAAAEESLSHWIYTGGLENEPYLIDRIARTRPLWGIGGDALRSVRDPFALRSALARADLPCPAVRDCPDGLPRDGSWLVKPVRSAGGAGIRLLDQEFAGAVEPVVFQARIEGRSLAALFVGAAGRTELLGVTCQRIGQPEAPFGYSGSVGPVELRAKARERVLRLGDALRSAFGLIGLFGVDLVLADGVPWPVEVNPRYTASAEVIELATGRPVLERHAAAFGVASLRPKSPRLESHAAVVGKAILFADAPCEFPANLEWEPRTAFDWPEVADVPRPGESFAAGDPVLTVFARAENRRECEEGLLQALGRWRRRVVTT